MGFFHELLEGEDDEDVPAFVVGEEGLGFGPVEYGEGVVLDGFEEDSEVG